MITCIILAVIIGIIIIIQNSNEDNNQEIPIISTGNTTTNKVDNTIKETINTTKDLISTGENILNTTQNITEEVAENTDNMGAKVFNSNFERYEGEQKGSSVKSLIQKVDASSNTEHKIKLTSNDIEDFNNIKTSSSYVVTLKYGTDGYVSEINIDTKK